MMGRCFFVGILISFVLGLSACGGGGGGSSSGAGGGGVTTYGSLTFSGPGAADTGSGFVSLTRTGVSLGTLTTTEWYGIDLKLGTYYPYLLVIVGQDNGVIQVVEVVHMTSDTTASGQWLLQATPSDAEATVTAGSITFTNLTLPGYGATPVDTTLVLNGTLNL